MNKLRVQGVELESIQYAVLQSTGYAKDSRRGRYATEATEHAVAFLNRPHPDLTLTYREHLLAETEKHVRNEMGAAIWTIILSAVISAVVRLIVDWWIDRYWRRLSPSGRGPS